MDDCKDLTDEHQCDFIRVNKDTYKKRFPPIDPSSFAITYNVHLNLTLSDLENFDDNLMTFKTKLEFQMSWYDDRLQFMNLHLPNESYNTVKQF